MVEEIYRRRCPKATYGEHDADRSGRCNWCGRIVCGPVPKPRPGPGHVVSELEHYYRTMWDPDYHYGEYNEEWRY